MLAAVIEPENTEGRNAVNSGGGFVRIDGDDSPGLAAADERATRVGRAEAALEVHGGAEGVGLPLREVAREHALQRARVAGAVGVAGAGCAALAVSDELEELGLGLAEAKGVEAKRAIARGGVDDAADDVAVVVPELQGAAIVVGGEGVPGSAEIEGDPAVFEDGGVRVVGEEGLDERGDLLRGTGPRLGLGAEASGYVNTGSALWLCKQNPGLKPGVWTVVFRGAEAPR